MLSHFHAPKTAQLLHYRRLMILIDKGLLNSQRKSNFKYWPEYGKNGKEDTTVEMLLNHSAGLPALKTKVKDGGSFRIRTTSLIYWKMRRHFGDQENKRAITCLQQDG